MTSVREKIVVFTGAGVSAESGIQTFRGDTGVWCDHAISDVATYEGWLRDTQLVLDFYNQRRRDIAKAEPNPAHVAIAELQSKYDVVVVTQNIDDLHERAGSKNIIHVHGELTKARGTDRENTLCDIGYQDLTLESRCPNGSQLRPHVVWFGEEVLGYAEAQQHFQEASKILVVGTSLAVFPVANLLSAASPQAEKIIVTLDVERVPSGYQLIREEAGSKVPHVVDCWLRSLPLD
ncbi:MAG: NAD-dependent protein deacylase [Cellvibrionaceae bacterium]